MKLCEFMPFTCMMLLAVHGLRCYTCWGENLGNCNRIWTCPAGYDRCSSTIVAENMITKKCMRSDVCRKVYSVGMTCCSGDLCNGANPSGVSIPLLLVPLVIIVLFC
ncbi:lymphocyte antigen 6B-like [Thalassophryne amazonica]|uniref:lymphocyte antigen 6B-like n=1 Tax=Thalassophryne amazonica TaxID=390379 RepID=UPI001471C1EB|nr:lymphocyte antigen 6B-like [Thalassophryne amazonica]